MLPDVDDWLMAISFNFGYLALHIQQVDQGHNEHPNQIDEVPVKRPDLDVSGGIASSPVAQPDHDQSDHAADHVGHVQSGDGEESGAEHRRSPRVLEQARALADQTEPFPE